MCQLRARNDLLLTYSLLLQKLGVPGKMTRPPPQPDKQSSVLWLRGLSARCSEESLGASFEQWGGRVVRTLVDPISYVRNGQALIALDQYEKVCHHFAAFSWSS